MSKYCPIYQHIVLSQDCVECDTKECLLTKYKEKKMENKDDEARITRASNAQYNINYINHYMNYDTKYSISKSCIYKPDPSSDKNIVPFCVTANDSVTEVKQQCCKDNEAKICVLDFASYTHAGGAYLEGGKAQEEDLCTHSTLYPVLSSHNADFYAPHIEDKNSGLYTDECLYIPGIAFYNKPADDSVPPVMYGVSDVIVCAAPNANTASRNGISKSDIEKAMFNRISTIFHVVFVKNKCSTLIAGAFGCGVFGNDPAVTAALFKQIHDNMYPNTNVVFAIPGNDGNREIFETIFFGKK